MDREVMIKMRDEAVEGLSYMPLRLGLQPTSVVLKHILRKRALTDLVQSLTILINLEDEKKNNNA